MSEKPTYEELKPKVGNTIICFLAILILTICVSISYAQEKKHILILHSYHKGQTWNDSVTQGVESILNSNGQNIELYFEYMDTKRFYSDQHLNNLYQLLSHKFHNYKFDAIICADDYAFNFILERSHELFPKTPIVFCGVNNFDEASLVGRKWITGVVESTDLSKTIKIALRLNPESKNVFILVDKTMSGMAHREQLEDIVSHFNKTLTFDIPSDIELSSLKNKLHNLPEDSIVLWMNFFSDKFGNPIFLKEVSDLLQKYCSVPVYSLWDTRLGKGALGGMLTSGHAQGEEAAKIALRIINGEKVKNIPVMKESPNRYMFDYKQLKRFNIKSSLIPNGSIIINKPSSFYSKHAGLIWLSLIITAGLSMIIFFLVLNILKRKQVDEALRESEGKYRDLTSLLPLSLFETDDQGNVTFANPFAFNSLGYTQEDIDKGLNMLQVIHPGDHDKVLKRSMQVMQGVHTEGSEYLVQRKDGSTFPTYINTSASIKGDRPVGLMGYVFDLTQQKNAEQALRESEEKLIRAKKMEALGLLAGGVAHDLNNVLSGIVSYPELLLMDLPEDSKLRKPIETIQATGHRAAAIVQDLLTVARGVAIVREPLSLNEIVEDYLLSPEFEKLKHFYPAVTVKTNLDADLLNISGSHIHLRKVVMNLVSNASEAIESSGNITVSTMSRYMDRPLKGYDDINVGEFSVLSVTDDGSGISTDDLERVFEPFYTKKVMGRSGTGLGLAVVWNVVRDHRGYIDVTSDENGTVFELYFPTTRDEISGKDLSIDINDYKGDGETVLVVDDMESQRKISCHMLDKLGYKTKAVSSGEEAVEYLKDHAVDLVLLDMIMDPGINGRETYERIIKIHPNQKAVIASGFAETDDVKEAQGLGAGKYIRKPLTLKKIGLAVKDELEK